MQVLVIGARGWEAVDEKTHAFREAFRTLGHAAENISHRDLLNQRVGGVWGRVRRRLAGAAGPWPASWLAAADAAVLAAARRQQPALVVVLKGETLSREMLQRLVDLPSRPALVNVFPDNPYYYPTVMPGVGRYQRFYVKDSFVVARMQSMGYAGCRYLPLSCDPAVHHPLGRPLTANEQATYVCDVGLAGSIYTERLAVLRALEHLDLRIWCGDIAPPWDRDPWVRSRRRGPGLQGEAKRALAAGARISLNTHHPLNDIHGVNDRIHEMAGCGGVVLVDDRPDLAGLYEPGREVLTFRDLSELREQAARLLREEPLRRSLAQAATRRAHAEHTFLARARTIIADLGL